MTLLFYPNDLSFLPLHVRICALRLRRLMLMLTPPLTLILMPHVPLKFVCDSFCSDLFNREFYVGVGRHEQEPGTAKVCLV
jgi:hypothetical protein